VKQTTYIVAYCLFLAILAGIFIFQIKFTRNSSAQLVGIAAIIVVWVLAHFLNKSMKKEKWFKNLHKN